jgi:hypothetical protein
MKVKIKGVFGGENGLRVRFECGCGEGIADWDGPKPVPGDQRFVELSLGGRLSVDALTESNEQPGIAIDGDSCVLKGAVSTRDDGSARMDLGCGEALEFDVGDGPPIRRGSYELIAADLKLFDVDY